MTWTRYMVDTNVLGRLTVAQRSSRFLRENCRVPEEVLFEASGFRDIASLAELAYPFTVSVAEQLRSVMASIPPGDFALVDLYHNRGNADPLLIAMALDAAALSEETLLHERWMVVTEDAAVRATAHQFGLETATHNEFVALLDGP